MPRSSTQVAPPSAPTSQRKAYEWYEFGTQSAQRVPVTVQGSASPASAQVALVEGTQPESARSMGQGGVAAQEARSNVAR